MRRGLEGAFVFSVKWVSHNAETKPIAMERYLQRNLDEVVFSCKRRLPIMRLRYAPRLPDGFLIFDETGTEVRRWFGSARVTIQKSDVPQSGVKNNIKTSRIHPPDPQSFEG